jgi:DNA-binding beta-propeller fold protein YncE
MRRITPKVKTLLYALALAAFAVSVPAAASAQTTMVIASDPEAQPTKTVAPTDTTAVTSVGLDAGVTSLASDSNGNVYATLQYSNKVVKMNGGGTVIGTFAVGRNPTGLIVDSAAGVLYALNNADNTISKLGLDGTAIATFSVAGDGPVYAALYNGTLYVACERSNSLVRLSASNGAALGSTNVGARPVWVKVGITTTNFKTMPVDQTAAAPTDGTTMVAPAEETTVDGDSTTARTGTVASIYVSCNKDNQVWKLSAAGAVLAKFDTGRGPFGLAVNSRGELLVACFWDAVVLRLDANGLVLSKTAVGDGPAGLIPYGNVVAVVSNGANSVSRLSLVDGTFISKDLVDRSPLIGTATNSALWVACTGNGTIAKRAL